MKNDVTSEQFFALCQRFAEENDALECKDHIAEDGWGYFMSFRLLQLEFIFYTKATILIPKNTMTCRVFLKKNSFTYFLLSDLMARFSENDFRATYFWHVNAERLEPCFSVLTDILKEYMPKFEEAYMEYQDEEAYDSLFNEYKKIFKLKPKDLDFSLIDDIQDENFYKFQYFQRDREQYMICRFTQGEAYLDFLSGNIKSALLKYQKLEKKDDLYEYDKKLIEFLKTPAAEMCQPMPRSCMEGGKSYNIIESKGSGRQFLLYTLIAFVPFSVLFCLIVAAVGAIVSIGSMFSFTAPWYLGFIPASLCAVLGGIVFKKRIARIVEGKKAQQKIDQDEMLNSKGVNVFATVVFIIAFVACLCFSLLVPSLVLKVYDDRMEGCETTPFVFEKYYYNEIEAVYHIDARYNEYGDRIERPSYVVVMKDSRVLDFDVYVSDKETKEKMMPIFEKNDIEIVYLDSDRDLP